MNQNVSKCFSELLPVCNTLTIHSCFLEGKSQQKYCSSHSNLFSYDNKEQPVQKVEFLSWCKHSRNNKYGYDLRPLNGS